MNSRLQTAVILVILFLAAWTPRVLGLERFVTIDERKWLARSANFYQAITHGDWTHTFQREHPGVTVMWAGTLAFLQRYPNYAREAPGQFTWEKEHLEAWLKQNSRFTPLTLLASGRWWVVLVIGLALALSYLPLRRLFGAPIAALAALFVAWDPFAVALSQQLHPDGFVAVLTFLALILFLTWLYGGRQWGYLIGSGIVMGLAWLTKTPAIFLVPAGAVLILYDYWRPLAQGEGETGRGGDRERGRQGEGETGRPKGHSEAKGEEQGASFDFAQDKRGRGQGASIEGTTHNTGRPLSHAIRSLSPCHLVTLSFVLWGLIATLTFILLWPAMWVDPLGTLLRMANEMGEYVERHTTINYFLGRPVDDPGPIFYPIAFFFRTTPATLIGLVLAGIAAWRRAWPLDTAILRRTALGLLVFALVLTAGMTLGAKKFDRYLVPAFPALDILAVFGWFALGRGIGRLRDWRVDLANSQSPISQSPISQSPNLLVTLSPCLLVCFFLHALLGFLHYPYYLTYYNPLAGGSLTAPKVLIAGWGEGLDEAARWLNQQPDAEQLRVVSWYVDGPFSYFFKGQAVEVGYSSPLFWLDTDYAVLYINQWQRQQPTPEAIAYFLAQTPAYTVRSGGMDLAYVYDMRNTVLPAFVDIGTESVADFGGKIRLSAYEVPQQVAQPGDQFFTTLYLQSLAPMEINYNILVRLTGQDGVDLWREEGWPWGAPTSNWPLREIRPDGHTVVIPADAKAGLYKLNLSIYDPATFDPLPVTAVKSDQLLDPGTRDVALVWVGTPPTTQQQLDQPWQFDRFFALSGATLPTQGEAGAELPFSLQWESLSRTARDYTVFVHLVDRAGNVIAQQDRPPLDGFAPTHLWAPGLRLVDDYAVALPADLPTGQYEVRTGLYTLDGGRLTVSRNGESTGDYAIVGSFTVE